jgi:TolB protein
MKKSLFLWGWIGLSLITKSQNVETIHYKKEKHLSNVHQLTFGGNNAEAYFSPDGKSLIFQSDNANWGVGCDQIFTLRWEAYGDSTRKQMISTGKGRTTCSWYMPDGQHFLYASTHQGNDACPPVPEKKPGQYVWPLYRDYDIYVANMKGAIQYPLTQSPRYDAEATISPKGDKIVFTSLRNGDLDLYTMDIDGQHVQQITSTLGYDGGATFSPDGTKIVWRASRPTQLEEVKKYRDLLEQDLVEPSSLEIFVANADGSDAKQITHLGNANWSPTFTPDGKSILFCSNYKSNIGFPFNMFLVNIETGKVEQVTYDTEFDSFPMFSPDGKKLVWCSNRNNGRTRDTNIFIADWK